MKAFHFPLETLLKVKSQIVQNLQMEVSELQKQRLEEQKKLNELQEEILSLERDWNEKRRRGELKQEEHYKNFSKSLHASCKNLHKKLGETQESLEYSQRKAEKALQERKTIEKLREKHYSQWKRIHDRADHEETAFSNFSDA